MAYGVVDATKFASSNPADQNSMAIAAGYTGKEDYLNNRGSTQSSTTSTSAPLGGGSSWEDTVKKAIEMQQTANAPVVASLNAQIPEIKSQYAAQTANVTAQQKTLNDRYDALLKSLDTTQTKETNAQTVTTANELGKRGLLPSSTLAQQEIINATTPITDKYTGLRTTAALDQTEGQTALMGLLNQLTSGETSDIRGVLGAIAQLQSGASTSGMQLGTNIWGQNQATQAAQAAQTYKEKQDAIANEIAKKNLENETKKTTYEINKPYSTTGSSFDNPFLTQLLTGQLTNQTQSGWTDAKGNAWKDTNKEPVKTIVVNGKQMTQYSDGSVGPTIWTYK